MKVTKKFCSFWVCVSMRTSLGINRVVTPWTKSLNSRMALEILEKSSDVSESPLILKMILEILDSIEFGKIYHVFTPKVVPFHPHQYIS